MRGVGQFQTDSAAREVANAIVRDYPSNDDVVAQVAVALASPPGTMRVFGMPFNSETRAPTHDTARSVLALVAVRTHPELPDA